MPKMKTKSGAAKRFKLTASGKIKVKKSNLRHILTKKNSDYKRKQRKAGYLDGANRRNALRSLALK